MGLETTHVELVEKSPERIKALKIEYPNLKISNSPPPIDGYVVILGRKTSGIGESKSQRECQSCNLYFGQVYLSLQ